MKCPVCNSKLSIEMKVHEANAFKSHRIRAGLRRSNKKLGALRKINRNEVLSLRLEGKSLQTIANILKISKKSVCNILSEEENV